MYNVSRLFVFFVVFITGFTVDTARGQEIALQKQVDYYGNEFYWPADSSMVIVLPVELNAAVLKQAYNELNQSNYQPLLNSLLTYRKKYELNDWLYYQLIRKVAQQLSAKQDNYGSYTFYKWFMLLKSGYDARIALVNNKIIFYVYNDEDISDIPFFMVEGKKYMCLNYHDYTKLNLDEDRPIAVQLGVGEGINAFSYKVTRLPDFKATDYIEKELGFVYHHQPYHFRVKLNKEVDNIFANYPGVDFESYFNIPLSKETYSSLIPLLKKNIGKKNQQAGVDYLMRFTRYAFLYEDDQQNYGKEKRLSPEETLAAAYSDCDDRAALFFYLVKEIYNLPMIVLLYPEHITVAVGFGKPVGVPIWYKGRVYAVCEPTAQKDDQPIGRFSANLKNKSYEVVYQYEP